MKLSAVLQQRAMLAFLTNLLLLVRSRLRSRARLEAENLVLRQQVVIPEPQESITSAATKPRPADLSLAVPSLSLHSKRNHRGQAGDRMRGCRGNAGCASINAFRYGSF